MKPQYIPPPPTPTHPHSSTDSCDNNEMKYFEVGYCLKDLLPPLRTILASKLQLSSALQNCSATHPCGTGLDTGLITDLSGLLEWSTIDLTYINVSSWDVGKVTNMNNFFQVHYRKTRYHMSTSSPSYPCTLFSFLASSFTQQGDLSLCVSLCVSE